MLVRQHAPCRLLRHQKAAEGADRDRLRHIGRHQVDKGAARPAAGVVDDNIGRGDFALDQTEQPFDFVGIGGIAGKGFCAGLGAELAELFDFSRGERDLDVFARKQPRQRSA